MSEILQKLRGGDLRSIGRAEEVVQDILRSPSLFGEVFDGMLNDDPLIRMRSADALEKVSSKHPEYLKPYKTRLISEVSKIKQQEVRWHVAQMFSRLEINNRERDRIIKILLSYIDTSESKIVKTFSMQTLADLAKRDEAIRPQIIKILKNLVGTGSPAMKNRGNKLIDKLKGF